MIEQIEPVMQRKVAGTAVKLDPESFFDPKIQNVSLMLNGRRVIACDYKNKKYPGLPRLILNAKKGQIVDHRNRNPLDNRKSNLRVVTPRQSCLNRKLHSNTGFIGVCRVRRTDRFDRFFIQSYFQPARGKRKTFFVSDTYEGLILAALARDKFVLECGDEEYAPLNFPIFKDEPFRTFLLKCNLNIFKQKITAVSEK